MSRVCRVDGPLVRLATNPDPLYGENMATAERIIGYEFYHGFYADSESRRVLKNGEPLRIPLTQKEYDVLEFFLRNPKKLIAREAVQPLDETVADIQWITIYLRSQANSDSGVRSYSNRLEEWAIRWWLTCARSLPETPRTAATFSKLPKCTSTHIPSPRCGLV
jgi:hypothetical protein